jgi:type IV fimbrial biogenesis protein FimT
VNRVAFWKFSALVSFTKASSSKVITMILFSVTNAGYSAAGGHARSGFTLIELIMTITVAGILLAIGVPAFQYVTSANRASGEINGLLGDMQFARGEAIKEGQTITICAAANGAPPCLGTTAWQNGWIVFSDVGAPGVFGGNDVLLKMQKTFANTDTLAADNGITSVTFSREGFTSSLPGPVIFRLQTTPVSVNFTRCLSATIVGALSTQIGGQITAEGPLC